MPRYYFHISTPVGMETDENGVEFGTLEEAILDARRSGRAMATEEESDLAIETVSRCSFEISDEEGSIVAKVPFVGHDA